VRLMKLFVIAMLLLLGSTANAQEQPVTVHVRPSPISQLPIALSKLASRPADIALVPRGEGARHGQLWINTAYDRQLYITGSVDGEQPDFPRTKEQILSKDHVEVWLSATPDVDLPEIGWGNQFDDVTLPKGADSCEEWAKDIQGVADEVKKCKDWVAQQSAYRSRLKRLFLREWLLTPDYGIESFATPAYEEIQKRYSNLGDEVPEILKPHGKVQMYFFPEQFGYSFEILIPFEALPPLSSLNAGELYLEVDVVKAAHEGKQVGAYSVSSAKREYGKPETFNVLRLDPPLYFSLTPCTLPLAGTDKRGGYHPAWFIPVTGPEPRYQTDTFILVNDPAGYRYEPEGLSPKVRETHYFWQGGGPGEWVCGPHLTYKKGNSSTSYPYNISQEGFEIKRLPGGELLLKTGPRVWYSEFGSGQCGACPRTDLRIFGLTGDMKIREALKLGDTIDGPRLFSQDFTVSADWLRITEFELGGNEEDLPGSWSSTTYCLFVDTEKDRTGTHVYKTCEHGKNVQPPNPPVLKELRDLQN
jgi:hypothetical protein